MKKELVWILGCVGLALALVEMTIGLRNNSIQEVQLHDTYFVFNPFTILIPVLAMVSALVYLARCILNGFSQVVANLILIGSTVIICLFGIAGIVVINQSAQGGWVVYPTLDATLEDTIQNPFASFLNGYNDLLIYVVAWWGTIAATTTVKTIMIITKNKTTGTLEFPFGKTRVIEDDFFGVLQFFDSKDKTKQHFEGKRSFSPANQPIWLAIDADFSGPTNEQKQFFRQLEDHYDELVEMVKPLVIEEYRNQRADFAIQDFKNEFTPVHLTIPRLPQRETEWELAFDTIHDSNHTVTIGFSNFKPAYIYIAFK